MSRTVAYIGLGSNLGNRRRLIKDALQMLREPPDTDVVAATEPTETAPLGNPAQPRYLNAVAELKTTLPAETLYRRLREIENALGRKRGEKWSSRTIDLDLLLFGDEVINSDTLTVPHPQMHFRCFVLKDLCRLNPKLPHPVLNETIEVLAARLNGCDYAPPTDKPLLISIAGNIGAGKTTLAKQLAAVLACRAVFEAYDTNPFLPKVYAGNKDLALDSQLYFLTSRVEQLNPATLDKNRPVVTDYIFQKEQIYANLLLSAEQLVLYQKIYSQLSPGVASPAVVIYLPDSPQQCLERIHRRNRPYEQRIETGFLEAIDAGYKKLIADWKLSPVITLTDFDCLGKKNIDRLAGQIEYYLHPTQADKPAKHL
jgi:2-amino-4-hydroxy-6-hydroxymethyldihydropteridine diphosphokinase